MRKRKKVFVTAFSALKNGLQNEFVFRLHMELAGA